MTEQLTPPTIVGRVGKMRVNGNGRYCDGVRTWQRVSNLLKNIETDTYHLDEWDRNMHVIGLAMRPDLVLGVAAAAQYDPETGKLTREAKSTLRGLRKQAMDAAKSKAGANQGSAVHTATERLDLGESVEQIGLPAPFDADLRAYEQLVRVMGLRYRPDMIERSVRNTAVDAVGTFDRFGESDLLVERGVLLPGEMIVVDVKTESAPLLNLIHIGPQLAAYANGDGMFVPEPRPATDTVPLGPYDGQYEPMPNVSKYVGLVIHVRDGRATPYLIDLSAGWKSALRAAEQRDELKASKIKLGDEGCWAIALPIDLPQPSAAEVAVNAAVRAAETGGQKCLTCHKPLAPGRPHSCSTGTVALPAVSGETQVAVRRPDGLVGWQPAGIPPGPQPLEAMLWEAVVAAGSIDELSALFERASATGVGWAGPIAEAGIARGRIVSCVQRAMHDASTTSRCACGWERGMAP